MTFRSWRLFRLACVMMSLLSVAEDKAQGETIQPWRIQAVIAALDDPSIEVERATIDWLSGKDVSDQRLADKVGVLLTDNRWNKDRARVVAALPSLDKNGAKFAPQVGQLLKDHDPDVQSSAARALGQMGEAGAKFAPQVAQLLKDHDPKVRSEAADALMGMGEAGAKFAPQVAELLKDHDPKVRSEAADALMGMGETGAKFAPQVVELLKDQYPDVPANAVHALGRMRKVGPEVIQRVADLLKDHHPYVRFIAAYASGEMGKAGANFAPQVAELLKDNDADVRRNAVGALGKMGQAAVKFTPQVAELLKDHDHPDVQSEAARALGQMGEAGAKFAPQVAELLKGHHWQFDSQKNAARALGQMGEAGAKFAPQVAQLLKDHDPWVRRDAADALMGMGEAGAKFAPQVAELLKDDDSGVREEAADVLEQMGEAGAKFAPQVAELLKDDDNLVRRDAAIALTGMGEAGAKFAPQVAELLKDQDPLVREEAPDALMRMGEAGAKFAPQVVELLKDQDDSARWLASRTLTSFPHKVPPPVIFACVEAAHTYPRENFEYLFVAYLSCGIAEENLVLIRFLGNRKQNERPDLKSLDHAQLVAALEALHKAWPQTVDFPKTRQEMAEVMTDVVRAGNWSLADAGLLGSLETELQKDFPNEAGAIRETLNGIEVIKWAKRGARFLAIQVLFWFMLIFLYPRSPMVQALFFWNKWPRRMFGLWYVGFVITTVPWLRRRMFAPFKEILVPANLQNEFTPNTYFTGSEVVAKEKGKLTRLMLKDVLGEIKGQTVLEGRSGLGKTMLLLNLALKAKSTVVYLRAVECNNGIVAAIQGKLKGQPQDKEYLETLIYAGAVDVLIDGVNEATPDARVRITKDVEGSLKGNFIVTTQQLNWKAPDTARYYVLQPLRTDQVKAFLFQQWPALESEAKVTKKDYKGAVRKYVDRILNEAQGQDRDDALVVLSNPMEATLAAELFAKGEVPDLFRLVEQGYDAMAKDFEDQNGRPFPLMNFSERVYEWKDSGNPYISVDGFEVEFQSLVRHKMVIQRQEKLEKEKGEEELRRWSFRHDKITDFFLVPAFCGIHVERRIEKVQDERFGGVYVLLALHLPLKEAQELHNFLVDWAAQSNQNDLLNRYTRAMKRRRDMVSTYGEKSGNDAPHPSAGGVAERILLG